MILDFYQEIFIITLFLLVLMSGITYALIGIAMPASYRMELDSDLETQVFQLIEQLKQTTFQKSNSLFDRFLMNTNATLLIRLPDNTIISPPSSVIFEDSENDNVSTIKENENKILVGNGNNFSDTVYDLSNAKEYSFSFSDMEKDCSLIVIGGTKSVNQVVTTLLQILPWIIGAIVFISLLAAFSIPITLQGRLFRLVYYQRKWPAWNLIVDVTKAVMMRSAY